MEIQKEQSQPKQSSQSQSQPNTIGRRGTKIPHGNIRTLQRGRMWYIRNGNDGNVSRTPHAIHRGRIR